MEETRKGKEIMSWIEGRVKDRSPEQLVNDRGGGRAVKDRSPEQLVNDRVVGAGAGSRTRH